MERVVFLHGFCGSPRTFDAVRAALGPRVRGETPVVCGHAGTDAPVTSFAAEVDRLAAAIPPGALPLLVGYSLGGRLAMGLVARHPGRWRGALFIGAHAGIADERERAARRQADGAWARLLQDEGLDRFLAAWEAQPLFASQRGLDAQVQALQRQERGQHDPARLAQAIVALSPGAMPCWDEALAAASTPMTYLVGAQDEKFLAVGHRLAARTPALSVAVAPGVGHNVALEAPTVTAAAIDALLARTRGRDG